VLCACTKSLAHATHLAFIIQESIAIKFYAGSTQKNSYKTSKIYNIFPANYGGNDECFNLIHYKQMMLAIRVAQNVYFLILAELLLYPRNCLGS
jgi:hypothetical protein